VPVVGATVGRRRVPRTTDTAVAGGLRAPGRSSAVVRLVATGGNIHARGFQARDSLLLAQYPTRRVYLMRRAGTRVDDRLEYLLLSRDSLAAAWREAR